VFSATDADSGVGRLITGHPGFNLIAPVSEVIEVESAGFVRHHLRLHHSARAAERDFHPAQNLLRLLVVSPARNSGQLFPELEPAGITRNGKWHDADTPTETDKKAVAEPLHGPPPRKWICAE